VFERKGGKRAPVLGSHLGHGKGEAMKKKGGKHVPLFSKNWGGGGGATFFLS